MITSRNIRIRQLNSPKIARRLIIGGISFLFTINIFISINYIIDKIQGCVASTKPRYTLLNTIYNTALSLVPLFTLFIFSLLILCQIRKSNHHHQISPITQTIVRRSISVQNHRKDVQFIKLALVQVAGYMLFNTLHGYNTIYAVITANKIKTANQLAIDGFLYGMGLNLHYTYTGVISVPSKKTK
jgi:hypothetical protein